VYHAEQDPKRCAKAAGQQIDTKQLLEKRDLDARIRQTTSAILTIVAMGIV
jgi:hypothetical protein